eukprot:Gb_35887 [translate_table: standard]
MVSALALAQPSRSQKKMVLLLNPMFQLQGRFKATTPARIRERNDNNSSKQSRLKEALNSLQVMDQCIDSSTYDSLLQGCLDNKALPEAKLVHAHIIQTGNKCRDISLQNKLVTMFAKFGSLVDARRVFDQMSERDPVSVTVMIAAYARHGHDEDALSLFYDMQRTGIQPNSFTFASALPACANLGSLKRGKEIHDMVIIRGCQSDFFVGNSLVDIYAKCGRMDYARQMFDKMPQRNVVSWNAMIAGYAQNRCVDEALKLFQKMPERDVISWTAIIAGYAQNGQGEQALKFFQQMQLAGVTPNSKTFASVLPACSNLAALQQGMEIHKEIMKSGFQSDVFVESALVDMYAKCGRIEKARDMFDKMRQRNIISWTAMIVGYAQNGSMDEALKLFQRMPQRNVVSWTAMIAGYVQNGHSEEALKLFRQMRLTGVKPNSNTFASVLPACASLAALDQGKEIHEEIIRSGFLSDVFVGNALVDMYAKCGSIENARNLFEKMHQRDVISWTAMIAGYAMHGSGKEALKLFEQMQQSGMNPDRVTLVGVLSACCHAGLVDEGRQYFDCMSQYYRITPAMEHYSCMVDLLGRAGHLDEAHDFINKMPMKADATVWGCLLGACRLHRNIELGECVAERLFELDPKSAAPYVLLSNIYAAAGRWDDIERVRKMMKDKNLKKPPGCSWIEVNKQVYAFLVGGKSQPQMQNIYAKL